MPAQIATQPCRSLLPWLTLAVVLLLSPVAPAQDSTSEAEPQDSVQAPEPDQSAAPQEAEYADTDPSALTEFKPELDPYGYWVQDDKYGLVWVPHQRAVGADFAPYVTSGHWALTPEGDWIWVSDYPFGWVVFHYGRWAWASAYGWVWIPGRRYSHAWVVWRVPTGPYAYVGWAPAPPGYVWVSGVAVSLWVGPPVPYVFCPSAYIFSYHMHHYIVVDRARVRHIARHTRRYRPHGRVRRHGPPARIARIPPRAMPRGRTPANPKAVAASRVTRRPRSTASGLRQAPRTVARSARNAPRAARPAPRSAVSGAQPAPRAARPAARTPGARPAAAAAASKVRRPAPRAAAGSSLPSTLGARSRPAPRTSAAPATRSVLRSNRSTRSVVGYGSSRATRFSVPTRGTSKVLRRSISRKSFRSLSGSRRLRPVR